MPDPPRPALKLKFGKKPPADPPAEPTPTPAPAEPSQPKLTLKIGKPKAQASASAAEEKPKKKKTTKKRPADNATQAEPVADPGPKRLKLNPSKKPGLQSIRIKNRAVVAQRPVGVGYDSEASDGEVDPAIEEQFILRMLPGEDCDYLRETIKERRFDKSEFSFKPLNREGRRAILKVRDKMYAATMVDLPCIVEGMKSWDRRGWYKAADICQMLLVLGQVSSDQEALDFPLPPEVEHPDDRSFHYPHGLAPPLKWVRKRRFRDRVSSRTIEQVEKAVEELIAQDETSVFPPRFELVDTASLNRAEGLVGEEIDELYDEDQDAEGEAEDYMMDDFDDDLAAEMEAALAGGDDDDDASAMPAEADDAATPSANPQTAPDDQADRESSDDDDDSDEGDVIDEEQLAQQRKLQQAREEIGELEALVRAETAQWERQQNQILRGKMGRRIKDLKKDIELKKMSAGLNEDADI